jgi:hypothetical protein
MWLLSLLTGNEVNSDNSKQPSYSLLPESVPTFLLQVGTTALSSSDSSLIPKHINMPPKYDLCLSVGSLANTVLQTR